MKKLFYAFMAGLLITSCTGNDLGGGIIAPPAPVNTTLKGVISVDRTLTKDKIWQLEGRVVIADGVTLTIEAGTIIKAFAGSGSQASTLIIARGGKINAQGTATSPIIMTSTSDNIKVGETSGTNLSENDRGLWGGLLILGKASGSFEGDVSETQIEGIPPSDTNGLYGGNNPTDNSGILQYVSIRHGGAEIGEGNEINGLTLGAVGSGTTIDHIEVVANVDDGIEFFGGTVNLSNLLIWAQGDDGLDIDQAYSGTITDAVVILGNASDHALEIDGGEGSTTGRFTMDGITLIGNLNTEKGEYADFRSNAMGTVKNVYAYGFKPDSDIELDKKNNVAQNFLDGKLVFGTWQMVLPNGVANVKSLFNNTDPVIATPTFGDTAEAITEGSQTVGSKATDFSWTYAKTKSAF